MSLSMLSNVFTDSNQSGAARLYAVGSSQRYTRANFADLINVGLYRNLSSATVFASSGATPTHIFFDNTYFGAPTTNYTGPFMQITNASNSALDVNFSNHGFNNRTASMLLVTPGSGGFELRFSMRDLFLDQWNTILDTQLSSSRASRNGDPVMTWEMWPTSIPGLSSNLTYLKVYQRLNIEIPWWPDYDASLTYHILLSLNGSGTLQGSVASSSFWVESGSKQGRIEDELGPQVTAGVTDLNTELANQLGAYSALSFSDVYLLPGNQATAPSTGVITGNTSDDVTIVVVL